VRRRGWIAAVVLLLAVGGPLAWYLGSPLFLNRTVSETFTTEGVVLAAGQFSGADSLHQGSGLARIVRTASGPEVRFEEFRVTNGPDLYVGDVGRYRSVVIYCRAFHVVFATVTLAAP